MPAKSQAQRGYLNEHFGHAWVKRHHFDTKGPLPEHAGGREPTMKKHHGHQHEGKPHMPYKTKGHQHDGGHHASHAKHNKAHGLPADMYGHDGEEYGSGGEKGGFCQDGNGSGSAGE